jgi:hypothetical protein
MSFLLNSFKYYLRQSKTTAPGQYSYLYQNLSNCVPELIQQLQNLFMHYADESLLNFKIQPHRYEELNTRYAESMLANILKYDSRSLGYPRPVGHRLLGICRDNAVLLCSILRYKNIPARLRVGFVSYFIPGLYLDHVGVEYWHSKQQRWCLVDVRTSPLHRDYYKLKIDFDLLDVPSDRFIPAANAWHLCRTKQINPNRFGSRQHRGLWYVRNRLMQDLAVLNKKETLIWDFWGMMLNASVPNPVVTDGQLVILDELAAILTNSCENLSALTNFYLTQPQLVIPKILTTLSPFGQEQQLAIAI